MKNVAKNKPPSFDVVDMFFLTSHVLNLINKAVEVVVPFVLKKFRPHFTEKPFACIGFSGGHCPVLFPGTQ
jgi:hypothetical protein